MACVCAVQIGYRACQRDSARGTTLRAQNLHNRLLADQKIYGVEFISPLPSTFVSVDDYVRDAERWQFPSSELMHAVTRGRSGRRPAAGGVRRRPGARDTPAGNHKAAESARNDFDIIVWPVAVKCKCVAAAARSCTVSLWPSSRACMLPCTRGGKMHPAARLPVADPTPFQTPLDVSW